MGAGAGASAGAPAGAGAGAQAGGAPNFLEAVEQGIWARSAEKSTGGPQPEPSGQIREEL